MPTQLMKIVKLVNEIFGQDQNTKLLTQKEIRLYLYFI